MDTAAIFGLETADKPSQLFFLPVMPTDNASLALAVEWAQSLCKFSGETVTIYRNGTRFMDVKAK